MELLPNKWPTIWELVFAHIVTMKAVIENRHLRFWFKLLIGLKFLQIIFCVGLNFSQKALIDTENIFYGIPNPYSAQALTAFQRFVVALMNPNFFSHSLLRESRFFPRFL